MPTHASNSTPEALSPVPTIPGEARAAPLAAVAKSSPPLPPLVAAWRRRRRIKRGLIALVYLIAAFSLALYLVSLSIHWGTFIVTSPVVSGPASDPTRVNRWEEHLLIGDGMIRLHPMYVYTWGPQGFNSAHADTNSKSLAWTVATNGTNWPTFVSNWGNSGLPIAHLPLWPLVFTSGALAAWLTARLLTRPKSWQCAKCRYDLRAQPPAGGTIKCPECGRDRTCTVCQHPTTGTLADEHCTECGWTSASKMTRSS